MGHGLIVLVSLKINSFKRPKLPSHQIRNANDDGCLIKTPMAKPVGFFVLISAIVSVVWFGCGLCKTVVHRQSEIFIAEGIS